jgi:hypothetical protein
MTKKERKTRRPFKTKGRMKIMIRARNREEAHSRLRAILIEQLQAELKSFDAPVTAGMLLKGAEFGMARKWWSPDAPMDIVETDLAWTNWKRGGWTEKRTAYMITKRKPGPIEFMMNVSAGKRVTVFRDAKGRFTPKGARRKGK